MNTKKAFLIIGLFFMLVIALIIVDWQNSLKEMEYQPVKIPERSIEKCWKVTDAFTRGEELMSKLNEEIIITGKGGYFKIDRFIVDDSNNIEYCLFIDNAELDNDFGENEDKKITVKGIVEKRVFDYSDCCPEKQHVCGIFTDYCLKVSEITPVE